MSKLVSLLSVQKGNVYSVYNFNLCNAFINGTFETPFV